jgi:hypothetical protein
MARKPLTLANGFENELQELISQDSSVCEAPSPILEFGQMVEAAYVALTKVLGNSGSRQSANRKQSVDSTINGIFKLLSNKGFSIRLATLFVGVFERRIIEGCGSEYVIEIDGGLLRDRLPKHVQDVLNVLDAHWLTWLSDNLDVFLEPLNLADQKAELTKLRTQRPYFRNALFDVFLDDRLNDLDRQIKLEDERIETIRKLKLENGDNEPVSKDEYDPEKRGLTRQLAMTLLDELFPNLEHASNQSKAEFLGLLVGWNIDGLRQKWTDYKQAKPETIAANMATAAEWKRKLKMRK